VEIESVDTVEEFWKSYQKWGHPAALPQGTNLYVFNYGVKPVWEDPNVEKGYQLEIKT